VLGQDMYYISKEGHTSPARVVKRLKDFMKSPNAVEGSTWTIRTKREIKNLDFFPTYIVENGKLKKTSEYCGFVAHF
jgi:hypothetical protein